VGIKILTEKLTLSVNYPSELERKLKPALKEINNYLKDSQIDLRLYKNHENETIVKFMKTFKTLIEQETEFKNTMIYKSILEKIPKEFHINSVYALILNQLKEGKDKDYIVSNITYTIKHASKNFPVYLKKALKNDYACADRELIIKAKELEAEKKKFLEERLKIEAERKLIAEAMQKQEDEQIYQSIQNLPDSQKQQIIDLAENNLKNFPPFGDFNKEDIKKSYMITAYKILNSNKI